VADWFAWMNNKMEGDIEKIRDVGQYFIEVWKACGMNTDNVEFLWSKDVMKDENYWKTVVQIGRNSTLNRIIRCSQIMGRKETDTLSAAQIFYPCMQCADIFQLKVDITQLGMDQRKVNILARELGPKLGFWKPVAVHHHMLMGLTQPSPAVEGDKIERTIDIKMSKSNPDSAIFMDDDAEEVKRKINKAYCPPNTIMENPLIDYAKHIIFPNFKTMKINRDKKYGGDVEFATIQELNETYAKGQLHPSDLKTAVAQHINQLLEPVRKHFKKPKQKKLLEQIKMYTITR
ncbi:tyrosine--tRNA ligase, partial [Candidatus Woesearchaeota archaeon]|nr:tyrosine--tRNA ligase [Candidatus Woesearchaeota archaeon]